MKISLFDFQKDALHLLRDKLLAARKFASSDNPQAIAFSAPTGSGKTIVMTALFEAILDEPDDQLAWPLDWQPQPDAVILWVSDMPELNEQTRLKIESQSDRIFRVNQLIPIESTFDAERLQGGRVYFINTQKLGNDKLLTKVGDGRQYSIWTTLSNTAKALPDRFYVVIDEAHRGMAGGRGAKEAQTLMQRFLLGYPEVGLVKMPLVIGVSATPQRFTDLLLHAPHTLYKVAIPPDEVRMSGLLKDRILIHHPDFATAAEIALLEEAARRWMQMTNRWARFCKAEGEQTVWPVLVVQVENGSDKQLTKTSLIDALNVIESAIGRRLNEGEVAHAMHDTGDLDVGGRRVRKVDASRIDGDKNIGVVFFKTSLSTGWDCPRAEVMMSFRRAEDHTYIAQLLGRMVRTPLARRIERDAALNDVHLFVPYFDTQAVKSVIISLHNPEEESWPRLFGQKTFFDKWNLASCGRLTGDAVGFDLPGFYTKRIELGGACGRRDARWESRQTFPRQAARCATAHRPQIHGVPSSCLTPLLGLRTRVPRSRRRPASCHPGSDGVVARCRSVDTWPGWLSLRRRCHRP